MANGLDLLFEWFHTLCALTTEHILNVLQRSNNKAEKYI
jgi:hypothetical protein